MRVAILARGMRRAGGVGRLITGYVRSLPKASPRDEFFVLTDEALEGRDRQANVEEVLLGKANPAVFDHIQVPQAVRRISPDVFLATKNAVPLGLKCPVVCVFLDLAYFAMAQAYPLSDTIYARAMLKRSGRAAARIIAVSQSTRNDIAKFLGPKAVEKTRVVYSGVGEPFRVFDREEKAQARMMLGTLPERFILYAGNISPRKNVRKLIEAFSGLAPGVGLVLTGHREWKSPDLARTIEEVSSTREITVLGGLPDENMAGLYNAAEISVYPSLYEGFGFPVLESFACGTPVAASNATSIPEVAGDAAVLFDPMETKDIEAAMDRLLSDEGLRREMRERGLRRAAEFNWQRTAEMVLGVLREVA